MIKKDKPNRIEIHIGATDFLDGSYPELCGRFLRILQALHEQGYQLLGITPNNYLAYPHLGPGDQLIIMAEDRSELGGPDPELGELLYAAIDAADNGERAWFEWLTKLAQENIEAMGLAVLIANQEAELGGLKRIRIEYAKKRDRRLSLEALAAEVAGLTNSTITQVLADTYQAANVLGVPALQILQDVKTSAQEGRVYSYGMGHE